MPGAVAKAAVIFLHGSGDDGPGARAYLRSLGVSFEQRLAAASVELHFPSARPIPYSLAGGALSSVWFDRPAGLAPGPPGRGAEHLPSVGASVAALHALVDELGARGIPARRVAIGGFSMGGGIALQAGFRYGLRPRLRDSGDGDGCGDGGGGGGGGGGATCGAAGGGAGGAARAQHVGAVFALSSYLCEDAELYGLLGADAAARRREGGGEGGRGALPPPLPPLPPLFMRHGDRDDFIRTEWGEATAGRLAGLLAGGGEGGGEGEGAGGTVGAGGAGGAAVDWGEVRGAAHEMVPSEVEELLAWLLAGVGAPDA